MSIETSKIMNLADGKILYDDLRERVDSKEEKFIKDIPSGSIAHISDAADGFPIELTVGIEPVQDLHGYDNPWPGGGGKNLFDKDNVNYVDNSYINASNGQFKISNDMGKRTFYISCKASTTYVVSTTITSTLRMASFTDIPSANAMPTATNAPSGQTAAGTGISMTTGANDAYLFVQVIANDDVSAGTTFENAADNLMLQEGSTVSSYEPYSNICSISGWSAVKIRSTGKNLFDNAITFANGKGLDNNGYTEGVSANWRHTNEFLTVNPLTEYTLQLNKTNTAYAGIGIRLYDSFHRYINSPTGFSSTADTGIISISFTTPENARYVRFNVPKVSKNFQFEEGSEATAYEAFGNTYEITIPSTPSTVYGGSLTVNKDGTGKLVAEYGMTTIPEITEFHDSTSGTGKNVWVSTSGTNTNVSNKPPICENVQGTTFVSRGAAWTACISTTAGRTLVFVPADLTIAEANAALQGSKIVYKLATPIEYTLTASQVNAIITSCKGLNNLFADSGDILSGTYYTDNPIVYELANKADKVSDAVNGNVVTFDANSNFVDSGVNVNDFALSSDIGTVPEGTTVEDQIEELNETKSGIIKKTISDSSRIHTFNDGADGMPMGLTVGIEPVQDLHGYDNPWPGGGGKNLIPDGTDTNNGYVDDYYLKSDGTVAYGVGNIISEYFLVEEEQDYVWGVGSDITSTTFNQASICFYDSNKNYISGIAMAKVPNHNITIPTGAVYARSTTGKSDYIQLIKGTTNYPYSPYSNVCPINGWSAVKISRTGKNLLPLNIYDGIGYNSSVGNVLTPVKTQNSWNQNANSISYTTSSTYTNLSMMTDLLPPGTYCFKINKISSGALRFSRYALDSNFKVLSNTYNPNVSSGNTNITLSNYGYIAFRFDNGSTASQTIEMQVSVTEEDVPYEPYIGNTYEISIPSTPGMVYGGTLTVNKDGTGKLVVDRKLYTIRADSGYELTDGKYFAKLFTGEKFEADQAVCSHLVENPTMGGNDGVVGFRAYTLTSKGRIILRFDATMQQTLEEFQQYVEDQYSAGTPVQIVVKRNVPYGTYDLTASQVNAIITSCKGLNNLFADTGDILSYTYYTDNPINYELNDKLCKNQGSANSGKFMKVGSDGNLSPAEVPNPQVMTGAAASAAGTSGLVPAPSAGDQDKFLKGNGAWSNVEALPAVTSSDNDKVLKVVSGTWQTAAAPTELPAVSSSDNDKVLKVVSGTWQKATAPTGLPAVSSSDNGKFLCVSNGAWSAVTIPDASGVEF